MLVDCPSPVGVIIKGTGLLFGAIVIYLFQSEQPGCLCCHPNLQIATQTVAVVIEVSVIRKTQISTPCHASGSCIK